MRAKSPRVRSCRRLCSSRQNGRALQQNATVGKRVAITGKRRQSPTGASLWSQNRLHNPAKLAFADCFNRFYRDQMFFKKRPAGWFRFAVGRFQRFCQIVQAVNRLVVGFANSPVLLALERAKNLAKFGVFFLGVHVSVFVFGRKVVRV